MTVQIASVLSNAYRLDGGAMFGNAPKALWERWMPADEQNRISLATRALLVRSGDATLLFEAGIGAYLDPGFKARYGVEQAQHVLLESLAQRGVDQKDVTHIFISHMHFDHAGGLLGAWQEGGEPELLFPNARYHVGEQAWERATHPHARDRASFIPSLHKQMEASGRLVLVKSGETFSFTDLQLGFFPSEGHTPGLLCADLRYPGGRLVFPSDLIPGSAWLHLPITMGYDRYPEMLINEKNALLHSAAQDGAWVYYVHDPRYAASRVRWEETRQTFVPEAAQEELVL
jgi:glyoxylase-like metal-dependent hydrolase (beta-lactamase superfamily II)